MVIHPELISVTCELTCKLCGKPEARTLNLPPDVSPPKEFTCSVCTGEKSIADGMTDKELAKCRAPLNEADVIRRREAIAEIRYERSLDWPSLNPTCERARQMFRADRWPVPGKTREERAANRLRMYEAFMAEVERHGWKCCDCECDLDSKSLCVVRFSDKLVPGCRRCAGRRAAAKRWRPRKRAA
jgi:hypothetical protein